MSPLLIYFKTLAARIRGRGPGFPPSGLPPLDDDPYSGVREPRKPSAGGRHSGIALDEPEEVDPVQARRT